MNHLKENLDQTPEDSYGTIVPNTSTAHFLLSLCNFFKIKRSISSDRSVSWMHVCSIYKYTKSIIHAIFWHCSVIWARERKLEIGSYQVWNIGYLIYIHTRVSCTRGHHFLSFRVITKRRAAFFKIFDQRRTLR